MYMADLPGRPSPFQRSNEDGSNGDPAAPVEVEALLISSLRRPSALLHTEESQAYDEPVPPTVEDFFRDRRPRSSWSALSSLVSVSLGEALDDGQGSVGGSTSLGGTVVPVSRAQSGRIPYRDRVCESGCF